MTRCAFPNCQREGLHFMSWQMADGAYKGMVCGSHDKELGRQHWRDMGMSHEETILCDTYMGLTAKLESYPDWPEPPYDGRDRILELKALLAELRKQKRCLTRLIGGAR